MKCNYSSKPAMNALQYVLIIAFIIGIGMLFTEASESIVTHVIFALIILGLIIVSNLKKGFIQAGVEKVEISCCFLGYEMLKKSIAYNEIDTVECRVDLETGRYGFIRYRLVTTIKYNSSNEQVFYTNLSIPKDLPVQNPDKYKKIIETHPMMELCTLISNRVRELAIRK